VTKALGEFEQLLLIALLEAGDDAHGVVLRRAIEARTGRVVTAGAVYTALDRLERRGYVSSWLSEPTPERGGRRKKHYRLEPDGALALSRSLELMRRMSAGLDQRLAEAVATANGRGTER
jgi:DNA-binding PadR family transcriptional regulator